MFHGHLNSLYISLNSLSSVSLYFIEDLMIWVFPENEHEWINKPCFIFDGQDIEKST